MGAWKAEARHWTGRPRRASMDRWRGCSSASSLGRWAPQHQLGARPRAEGVRRTTLLWLLRTPRTKTTSGGAAAEEGAARAAATTRPRAEQATPVPASSLLVRRTTPLASREARRRRAPCRHRRPLCSQSPPVKWPRPQQRLPSTLAAALPKCLPPVMLQRAVPRRSPLTPKLQHLAVLPRRAGPGMLRRQKMRTQ